jgi:hypothetical protein
MISFGFSIGGFTLAVSPKGLTFYVKVPLQATSLKLSTVLKIARRQLLYNLSDRTMVLYPVPRPSDMIGRGLVRKTSLIIAVGL